MTEIIAPCVPVEEPTAEQRWAELIRCGVVTPPRRPLTVPPERVPVASFEDLMRELNADREDRFAIDASPLG